MRKYFISKYVFNRVCMKLTKKTHVNKVEIN
jgi:hypothetical protein